MLQEESFFLIPRVHRSGAGADRRVPRLHAAVDSNSSSVER